MVLNDIKNDTLPFIGKKYYLAYYQGLKEPVPYVFKDSCYELVTDINKADFVYCGVPQTENKERSDLNLLMPEIERIKKSELPLICPNPDYMAVEGDKFVICQGLVSKTYEDMGGKVVYYGKPNADIFLKALENLKISNKSKALMVGDTIRTDIKGANNANIAACLTLSKSVTENEMVSKNIEVNEKNIFEYAKNWDAVPDFIIKKVSKEELF
ncbi:MAG: dUMP phosphatase [Alphaproteobacteria bacterium ADurb.Bin438]|nr:MAG: dUMP phosphatase [Alphaproteobacteria bacterium ADurb.Bin438]